MEDLPVKMCGFRLKKLEPEMAVAHDEFDASLTCYVLVLESLVRSSWSMIASAHFVVRTPGYSDCAKTQVA